MAAAGVGFTGAETPPGCLLASCAISCSAEAEDVRRDLAAIRRGVEARLAAKIAAEPEREDAESLAGHVMAVIQGMSTLGRDGASREKLTRVADVAMRAWDCA